MRYVVFWRICDVIKNKDWLVNAFERPRGLAEPLTDEERRIVDGYARTCCMQNVYYRYLFDVWAILFA